MNTNLYQPILPDLTGVSWTKSQTIQEKVRLSSLDRLWMNIWESVCESIIARSMFVCPPHNYAQANPNLSAYQSGFCQGSGV